MSLYPCSFSCWQVLQMPCPMLNIDTGRTSLHFLQGFVFSPCSVMGAIPLPVHRRQIQTAAFRRNGSTLWIVFPHLHLKTSDVAILLALHPWQNPVGVR